MTDEEWLKIIVPIVGTALFIFGALITRSTKVSEFRQLWINDQRADLAIVFANARRIAERGNRAYHDELLAFDLAADRIRLRKNPSTRYYKKEWNDVLVLLGHLRTEIRCPNPRISHVESFIELATSASREWLKKDWKRTRNGERVVPVFLVLATTLIFAPALPPVVRAGQRLLASWGWLDV